MRSYRFRWGALISYVMRRFVVGWRSMAEVGSGTALRPHDAAINRTSQVEKEKQAVAIEPILNSNNPAGAFLFGLAG